MLLSRRNPSSPTDGYSIELPFPPLVESWDRHDHPSQVRLHAYRDSLSVLAAPALAALESPLALGFHAAGRPDIAFGCDLDNDVGWGIELDMWWTEPFAGKER